MKQSLQLVPWMDIVDDLLELKSTMSLSDRLKIIEELVQNQKRVDRILVHPSFSLGEELIVVVEEEKLSECWFFTLHQGTLQKRKVSLN